MMIYMCKRLFLRSIRVSGNRELELFVFLGSGHAYYTVFEEEEGDGNVWRWKFLTTPTTRDL